VFADLDHGNLGGFDVRDVARAFEQMGEEVSQQELELFMAELDTSGKGVVFFGAFLDAVDKLPDDALTFPPPPVEPTPTAVPLTRSGNNVPPPRRAISPGTVKY